MRRVISCEVTQSLSFSPVSSLVCYEGDACKASGSEDDKTPDPGPRLPRDSRYLNMIN